MHGVHAWYFKKEIPCLDTIHICHPAFTIILHAAPNAPNAPRQSPIAALITLPSSSQIHPHHEGRAATHWHAFWMAERCLSQDVHDSTLLSAVTPDQSVIVITLQTLQQIAEQCMYASWGRSVGQLGEISWNSWTSTRFHLHASSFASDRSMPCIV